jgi:Predicted nucleotide-binding protein containing TIR-like domain
MAKAKVFIASSAANVKVAKAIANNLEQSAEVTVWDEGVFGLNDTFLERLLATPNQYDFAVIVWAGDDVTDSKGKSEASPRDNVIFECGLFMGVLGLERVFVVQDDSVPIKIPSDFAGVTLAGYDGTRINDEPEAAVRHACSMIERAMSPTSFREITGEWRQKYTTFEEIGCKRIEQDIEVTVFANSVSLVRYGESRKDVVFEARGRISGNRIRGEWRHHGGGPLERGPFLLVLNTATDAMYGYSGAADPNGGAIFEAWVLAKKTGRSESEITDSLSWGDNMLVTRTIGLPVKTV